MLYEYRLTIGFDQYYDDWRNNMSKQTCTWILNGFMLSTNII